jgi:hypothetical protein
VWLVVSINKKKDIDDIWMLRNNIPDQATFSQPDFFLPRYAHPASPTMAATQPPQAAHFPVWGTEQPEFNRICVAAIPEPAIHGSRGERFCLWLFGMAIFTRKRELSSIGKVSI